MTVSDAGHDPVEPEQLLQVRLHRPDTDEDAVVLEPAGDVDLLTTPLLADAVTAALASCPARLVIDLTGVRFLSSTGLSVLVQADRAAAGTGTEVRIVVPEQGQLRRTFTATGLHELLSVFPSRTDALTDR
ncbi:STAS domain-containing protein [Amycolatopsis sp. H6(2020)]|nr:STAS domain-containing protein [Amycolatopsis sp. H6(2020)]